MLNAFFKEKHCLDNLEAQQNSLLTAQFLIHS